MNRDRARAKGDDGAVLVEFAFVLPILAMFLFGTITAGMAWNTNLAMASGRPGGRPLCGNAAYPELHVARRLPRRDRDTGHQLQ